MKKWINVVFLIITLGTIAWGLITPNGLRSALENNAWSLKFIRQYYGTSKSEIGFDEPSSMHINSGFFLASQAMRQKKYNEAKEYLTPLVTKGDVVAMNNCAEIFYLQENYVKAFEIWEKTRNISRLHVAIDEAAKDGDLALRSLAFERLYRIDPESNAYPYADSLHGINASRSAIAILENSIINYRDSDKYSTWFNYLNNIYRSQKLWSEANQFYQQILSMQPSNWRILIFLCSMAYEQNRDPKELEDCFNAIESPEAESGSRLSEISRFYWQSGQMDQAIQAIEKAVQFDPTDINFLLQAGSYYEQVGLMQKALAAYKTVVELDPQSAIALKGIERLTD